MSETSSASRPDPADPSAPPALGAEPLLKPFNGARPPAPAWFHDAIAAPAEDGSVSVEGAEIVFRARGRRGDPGLILVHGGLAHLGWWDFVAPFLAVGRRVVAVSLSGMGASGWRDEYAVARHAEEAIAAGEAGGAFDHAAAPSLIAHSYGGFVALMASADHGARLGGAVIIDTPVRPPRDTQGASARRRGGKAYATHAAALERFRLLPEQPCENLFLVDHIARGALREVEGGWTWRHDPDLWTKLQRMKGDPTQIVERLACPMAFVRGAQSALVTDDVWELMGAVFGTDAPRITVPEARHHVMLDQPLALTAALQGLLSAWPPAVAPPGWRLPDSETRDTRPTD